MESNKYVYKRLRTNSREIRTISLSPGFWDDDISCTTQIVSLDHGPTYSALSYTWGDPESTEMEAIFLDGQTFSVMENLGEALRHLRQQTEARALWIDYLCIDQENRDEKSWQVNMMGDIYRACNTVYLWLGKESEESDKWCESGDIDTCSKSWTDHDRYTNQSPSPHASGQHLPTQQIPEAYAYDVAPQHDIPSPPQPREYRLSPDPLRSPRTHARGHRRRHDRPPNVCRWHGRQPRMSEAFALIHLFAQDLHINDIPGFVRLTSAERTDGRRFVEPVQALNAMMRRSWWHRMWTVQEVALPSNGVIMCGSLTLDWATMVTAARNWRRHSTVCCPVLKERLYTELRYPTHGSFAYITLSTFCTTILDLDDVKHDKGGWSESNFLGTYHHFSNRQATNPLDKVYGLLGVLSQSDRPILADYTLKMDDLNRKLSRELLLLGQLAVLYGEKRRIGHKTIPSWVKDFSPTIHPVDQRIDDLRNQRRQDYNAAGSAPATIRVCSKTNMSLLTLRIDKISATSRVFSDAEGEADMKQFLLDCITLINFSKRRDLPYQPGSSTTVKEAFFRTAFGNRCRTAEVQSAVRKPKESELRKLKEWVWSHDYVLGHTRLYMANNIKINIRNRRFFATDQGMIGFGPAEMSKGDEVFVVYGARAPIVLRPLSSTVGDEERGGSGNGQKGFTARRHRAVVGECYLHGVMEGEAIEKREGEMTVVLR